jgi:hypothetical protein
MRELLNMALCLIWDILHYVQDDVKIKVDREA